MMSQKETPVDKRIESLVSAAQKELEVGAHAAADAKFNDALGLVQDTEQKKVLHLRIATLWDSASIKTEFSFEKAIRNYESAADLSTDTDEKKAIYLKAANTHYGWEDFPASRVRTYTVAGFFDKAAELTTDRTEKEELLRKAEGLYFVSVD